MRPRPTVRRPHELDVEEWDDDTRGRVRFTTLFSGDRTPTDAMTSGLADIPAGHRFAAHRHTAAEIYHVLEGEGVLQLGGEEVDVGPGVAVFIPADCEHGIRNTGATTLRLFYVMAVDALDQVDYRFGQAPVTG